MKCYLCGSENNHKREGKVRDDASINILECDECGLVFLDKQKTDESFYKEGNMRGEGYKKAVVSLTSGANLKLQDNERRINFLKTLLRNGEEKLLDFGSGQGDFLISAKKYLQNIMGVELEQGVKSIYEKNNIALFENINQIEDNSLDIISSFHCLNYISEPINILKDLSKKLKENGKIIIEVPNANDALLSLYQNKGFMSFTYHICALYTYTAHTLELIAKKAGLRVDCIKGIQRYTVSNTLFWLSKNLPAGQNIWGFIDNKSLQKAYENTLSSLNMTDTLFAQFSKTNISHPKRS